MDETVKALPDVVVQSDLAPGQSENQPQAAKYSNFQYLQVSLAGLNRMAYKHGGSVRIEKIAEVLTLMYNEIREMRGK